MERVLVRIVALLLLLAPSGALADPRGRPPPSLTVTLANGRLPPPALIRAPDGRIFEFSLRPGGGAGYFDMTLLRPGHKPSATNLLEPKGNWHGVEPFQLSARPASDPSSQTAVYGLTRDIPVRNYPLIFHAEVREAQTKTVKDGRGGDDFVFSKLVLTAELRPAK